MPLVAAVDDSDRASAVLARAFALADDLDATLHVLHVLRRAEFVDVLEKEVESQALAENFEVQRVGREIVDSATAERGAARDADGVETVVRVGDPAEEILSYADEVDARLVIVGGRRRSPTGKALFGSVTQRILLGASVPILNVPLDDG